MALTGARIVTMSGDDGGVLENGVIVVDGRPLQITYAGGDGNDVVLASNRPPVADADGNVPKRDDYRLSVGLGVDI